MIWLEINALKIATDSGGVQKEAYFHKKACVTLRAESEWVELEQMGVNTIAGCNPDVISTSLKFIRAVLFKFWFLRKRQLGSYNIAIFIRSYD